MLAGAVPRPGVPSPVRRTSCTGAPVSDLDAERAIALDQLVGELLVEALQHVLAAMEDRHRGAGHPREPRELERDVAAADEDDPRRQGLELEELVAGGARAPRPGCRAPSGRAPLAMTSVGGVERPAVHLDSRARRAGAPCRAGSPRRRRASSSSILSGTGLVKVRLRAIRAGQSMAGEPASPWPSSMRARLDRLRGREQDLLRVAAALGAGAAVGEAVDDRHPQACLRAARRHVLGRGAAADHGDIVLGHRCLLVGLRRVMPGAAAVDSGVRLPSLCRSARPVAQHHSSMCENHS